MTQDANEATLREALVTALSQLREGAKAQVPESGDFTPLQARFAGAALLEDLGDVELRVGPASRRAGERERFLEVRVFTPSGASESSEWIYFGSLAGLRQALQQEGRLLEKAQTAVMEGMTSLLRDELP